MPGKNYANIALETTYGTPATTGYQGIRVADDGHESNVLVLQPGGIVYGAQGPETDGRRAVERDATGALKTYLPSAGILKMLQCTFGAPVTTELVEDEAYQYVFETSDIASLSSITTQIGRTFKAGGADRDTYAGGMVKEFRLAQAKAPAGGGTSDEGLAKTEFDMDYQRRVPGFAVHLPTYPTPELYHSVGGLTFSIGTSLAPEDLVAECIDSWALKYPTEIETDDTCASSLLKDKPTRAGVPKPTMDLGWTYKHRDYYEAWLAGEVLAFQALYEPAGAIEISAGIKPSVTWDIAAFGFTGKTPQMSESAKTKQDLPTDILWNRTNPMIRCTVVTSDAPPV
ncbi:MAG: hypothetical protein JWM89_1803 [Acidimicrobiales bacterium]|nr:hypothetical protein [Acidimicrobiales bacterium]